MEKPNKARSFELDAEGYDRIRPGYPQEMYSDLMSLCSLSPGDTALEVGAGTGKATLDLLRRGLNVTAVEPGEAMLEILKRNAGPNPALRLQQVDFEHFEPGMRNFSVAAFAQSFHWIKKPEGLEKLQACLKPDGHLVVFGSGHPMPFEGYFAEAQEIYLKFAPQIAIDAKSSGQECQAWIAERETDMAKAIAENGYFGAPICKTYGWKQSYQAEDYLKLLNTYSDHKTLPEKSKVELFGALRKLMDRYDGQVIKEYLTFLHVARRK